QDKRFLDYAFDAAERDRIVFAVVKQLVDRFKAERGGTLDRIIAKNAGGMVPSVGGPSLLPPPPTSGAR
ncbi:hypothetical protein HK405_008068, partial [Cladochytrium tenue]